MRPEDERTTGGRTPVIVPDLPEDDTTQTTNPAKPSRSFLRGAGMFLLNGVGFTAMILAGLLALETITPHSPMQWAGDKISRFYAAQIDGLVLTQANWESALAAAKANGELQERLRTEPMIAEAKAQAEAAVKLQYEAQLARIKANLDQETKAYAALFYRANELAKAAMTMETKLMEQQLLRMREGQNAQSSMANLADFGCVVGTIIAQNSYRGRNALQKACGVGQALRAGMVQEMEQMVKSRDHTKLLRQAFANIQDPATFRLQLASHFPERR